MARDNALAPGFLVASPRLDGSLFERAVIVMVHHDEQGAMGFIANKPLELDFGSLLEMVDVERDQIAEAAYAQEVFFGGPVRVEQLWVIYHGLLAASEDVAKSLHEDGEVRFHERWALSGTSESIESFAFGHEETTFRPFVGYAGWGPGQLESEIEEGSWLLLDFAEDLILDEASDAMWDQALARLGVNEAAFMMMGKAGSA